MEWGYTPLPLPLSTAGTSAQILEQLPQDEEAAVGAGWKGVQPSRKLPMSSLPLPHGLDSRQPHTQKCSHREAPHFLSEDGEGAPAGWHLLQLLLSAILTPRQFCGSSGFEGTAA